MNEKSYRTVYIRRESKRPIYAPFPVFLMDYDLSMTARVLYALMFNRAMLSQINNWVDDLGRVFIVFTEAEMCAALQKGLSTVKKALADLEHFDLLTRERGGFGKANRIYLRTAIPIGEKTTAIEPETRPSDSRDSDATAAENLTSSNIIESQYQSDRRDEISERTAFGRYGNIFLSEAEYAQLRLDYPGDLDRYIEEMSRYLSAHGRTYKNYEAAVRMWAANDKKQSADHGSTDYSYEGEDSL